MFDVRLVLKSGANLVVVYDDQETIDNLAEMFMDPMMVQFEFHDEEDDSVMYVPKANIDYIEVKPNVQ